MSDSPMCPRCKEATRQYSERLSKKFGKPRYDAYCRACLADLTRLQRQKRRAARDEMVRNNVALPDAPIGRAKDAPICCRCRAKPQVWVGGYSQRYVGYCVECRKEFMREYRQKKAAEKGIPQRGPVEKRRKLDETQIVQNDVVRAYRLKLIERAHREALHRRRNQAG